MSTALPSLPQLASILQKPAVANGVATKWDQTILPIQANNDYEALYCWLNEYKAKETTFKTYQKESERFLLWHIYYNDTSLASVNRDTIDQYISFLNKPEPKEIWCASPGGRHHRRGSSKWKPFVGPLSLRAQATAMSAIDSMFKYLVDAQYLPFNPMSLIRKKLAKAHGLQQQAQTVQTRILQIDEWHAMLDTLTEMPETSFIENQKKQRLIFLIAILFFLGLRINELTHHNWNAFKKINDHWWFFVMGKGSKFAKIPVNDELLSAMIKYRLFLKLSPLPSESENTPLIVSFKNKEGINSRQINKILKELAIVTANKFNHAPDKKNKIKKFSAHWLRHLSASLQDKSGIMFKHIRENLRHENDDTTRLYVHAFDNERHLDSQKLKWRLDKI